MDVKRSLFGSSQVEQGRADAPQAARGGKNDVPEVGAGLDQLFPALADSPKPKECDVAAAGSLGGEGDGGRDLRANFSEYEK